MILALDNAQVRGLCLAAAMAVSASLAGSAAAAEPVRFAPHRAVYDIALGKTVAGTGVAALSGRMVYELNGSACEGYTQNMRFVTRMTNQEGVETLNDLRNSSFEDASGGKLRFASSQYQNDKLAEASQGDATRQPGGQLTAVELEKPAKKRVSLPADIYFPMQHSAAIVTTAKAGGKFLAGGLFDGAEKGEKYYETHTVIGKLEEHGARTSVAALKDGAKMAAVQSWPIAISYFEPGKAKQDSTPSYELTFRYFENGVTSDLGIDYGEFAIKGTLTELVFLDAPKCPGEH